MSLRLDIRLRKEDKEKIFELAYKNNLTVTNVVKAFVLDCAKNDKFPFSTTLVAELKEKGINCARINTRFDDSLKEDIDKFYQICDRNIINATTVIKTYLLLCCRENKILIKPDIKSGAFCNRSFAGFKKNKVSK